MASFDLKNPGVKEYAIVGGVVLGGALIYFWWKKRQAAAAAPADTSGDTSGDTTAPGTPTGLSTSAFLAWIQDHSSSTTTTAAPKAPGPVSGKAEVPNVVGMKGSAGEALLKARGFRTSQSPARTPAGRVTRIVGQEPGASQQPKGSTVHVTLEMVR